MESEMKLPIFIENKSQITDLWKNVWKRFDLKACLSARLIQITIQRFDLKACLSASLIQITNPRGRCIPKSKATDLN